MSKSTKLYTVPLLRWECFFFSKINHTHTTKKRKKSFETFQNMDEKKLQSMFTEGENPRKIPKIIFIVSTRVRTTNSAYIETNHFTRTTSRRS